MSDAGKWATSKDEENFIGAFESKEHAIVEGKNYYGGYAFWVGQIIDPVPPHKVWDAYAWIDQLYNHDDYSGDWAENSFSPSREQLNDLEVKVQETIRQWMEHWKLKPSHYCIDYKTVEKVS